MLKYPCFEVSLFADDTVIYLNGNPSQFKHVFAINKSNSFYVGSSRRNVVKPFSADGLSWLTNTIKYLSVYKLYIPINHFDNNSVTVLAKFFCPILMK